MRTIAPKPAAAAASTRACVKPRSRRPVELEPVLCPRAPPRRARRASRSPSVERQKIVPRWPPRRGRCRLPVGVCEALEGRRSDEDGHGDLLAEHGRRSRHRADVDEHSRPQHPAVERRDVLAQRPLVARPAGEVAARGRVEPPSAQALVLRDVQRLAHASDRRTAQSGVQLASASAARGGGTRDDVRGRTASRPPPRAACRRLSMRQAHAVRPVGRHGVESVADEDDARLDRDLLRRPCRPDSPAPSQRSWQWRTIGRTSSRREIGARIRSPSSGCVSITARSSASAGRASRGSSTGCRSCRCRGRAPRARGA